MLFHRSRLSRSLSASTPSVRCSIHLENRQTVHLLTMTNLQMCQYIRTKEDRKGYHAPCCSRYGLVYIGSEKHKMTYGAMRTNRKLRWIAIRVDEDFEGVVPRATLDKVPDRFEVSQAAADMRKEKQVRTEGC